MPYIAIYNKFVEVINLYVLKLGLGLRGLELCVWYVHSSGFINRITLAQSHY